MEMLGEPKRSDSSSSSTSKSNEAVRKCRAKKKLNEKETNRRDQELDRNINDALFVIQQYVERCKDLRNRQPHNPHLISFNVQLKQCEIVIAECHQMMNEMAKERELLKSKYSP
uniref:BZIP domain-containing protein n=1 Tax=Panagrolaimus sp. JU765 TaxID=591449 RepID=A0AC34RSV7_9BILA